VRYLRCAHAETPEFVLRRCPEFDPRCLLVQYARSVQQGCFMLATSYVPARLGQGLSRRKLGNKPVLSVLAERSARAATGEQTTSALAADAATAELFAVPPGSPVLFVQTLIQDAQQQPVEYRHEYFRADCYRQEARIAFHEGSGLHWKISG